MAACCGGGARLLSLQTRLVFPHQSELLGLYVEEALVIRAAAVRGLGRLLGVVPLGSRPSSQSVPRPLQVLVPGRRFVKDGDTRRRQGIKEPVVVQDKIPGHEKVRMLTTNNV